MKNQEKWIVEVWDALSHRYVWLQVVEVKGYRATPHFIEFRHKALIMNYTAATNWSASINKEQQIARAILA